MKKLLMLGLVIAVGAVARADYAIYGGDVAIDDVTSRETRILFGGKAVEGRTYTLSKDASIYSGGCAGANQRYIFDFTDGNHVLTLRSGDFLIYQPGEVIEFKGGVWDFNDHQFSPSGKGQGTGLNYDNYVVLTNRCVMTNLYAFGQAGDSLRGSNCVYRITDGSTLHTPRDFIFLSQDDGDADHKTVNALFEVSGGSRVYCRDFTLDNIANGASADPDLIRNNVLRVTGLGSSFESPQGSFAIKNHTSGNVIEADDYGKALFYYPRIGSSAKGHDNTFRAKNHGEITVTAGFHVGNSDATYGGFVLEALNGGILRSGSTGGTQLQLQSSNNRLLVSNGVIKASNIILGALAAATNNELKVMGANSDLSAVGLATLFGGGTGNRFVLADHAAVTAASGFAIANGSYNGNSNLVSVTDHASLSVSGEFRLDQTGNLCEIGADGTLNCSAGLNVYGTDNTLVVSNGTINATVDNTPSRDSASLHVQAPGARLVFRGDSPKFNAPKASILFNGGAKLRFELPSNGYASDEPIMDVLQIMNYDGMDYEITGVEEMQENIQPSKDIVLVKCRSRMWDGSSAFAAITRINATLPEGCKVSRVQLGSGLGDEIRLHVKSKHGMLLLVR